jgi:exopolysaccharide production protein ExoQ
MARHLDFEKVTMDAPDPIVSHHVGRHERIQLQSAGMSQASLPFLKSGRMKSSGRTMDKFAFVPVCAIAYSIIVAPLLGVIFPNSGASGTSAAARIAALMQPRPENKIFWPAMVAITVVLVARNHARFIKLTWPPHVKWLVVFLAYCGASVLWAFKPDFTLTRFVLASMIIISIVLPGMLADRSTDIMRGVFLCFALASVMNIFFVLNQRPMLYEDGSMLGYSGYFSFKGILGECAAITFLLSLREMLYPGFRRVVGVIVAVVAISLVFPSYSKGSLAFAIIAPCVAGITLMIGRKLKVSPAIVLLPVVILYQVLTHMPSVNLVERMSWYAYGNYSVSGRTVIWDFVRREHERRPLLGWGFGSFWQVGSDGPSITDCGGWVCSMPSGHSGYWDTLLELGDIGYPLLIIFIMSTLHAVRRVADGDATRAWLLLSLALYVIITNMIESVWMAGGDMNWMIFLLVVAEIGRYWNASPSVVRSRGRRSSYEGSYVPPRGNALLGERSR